MKVVLRKDVPTLGHAGEVKEVSDGYGRNYLIPRGLAAVASKTAVQNVEAHKASESRQQAKMAAEHDAFAKQLNEMTITVHARSGEQGRLYGSVTSADIAEELSRVVGRPVEKRDIDVDDPIRAAGTHKVKIHVAPRIVANLTVEVVGDKQ